MYMYMLMYMNESEQVCGKVTAILHICKNYQYIHVHVMVVVNVCSPSGRDVLSVWLL